jgi:hypothetical protein
LTQTPTNCSNRPLLDACCPVKARASA